VLSSYQRGGGSHGKVDGLKKSGGEGKKKQKVKNFVEKVETYIIFKRRPLPPSPQNSFEGWPPEFQTQTAVQPTLSILQTHGMVSIILIALIVRKVMQELLYS
jgi:hypothetical protein